MEGNSKIPNLFIIGAPKCGTTSMIQYLGMHRDVFVSPVKEPHYFNEDSGHRYFKNEADYLTLFSGANNQRYRCEGSVWYLYSKHAIHNILQFNPDARFIIMLRNPTEMFFSLHQEMLFGGSEDVQSANEAWELQVERARGRKIPVGALDPSYIQYGEACKLGEQAKKAVESIPNENLLFVLLDDLKIDPDGTYKKVLKFLNLEQQSLVSYEVINVKKVRKSYALSKALNLFTRMKRKLGIKGGFGIANKISAINVTHDVAINLEEKTEMVPMLNDFFRNDINLLESVINRDLTHWKSQDV